MTNDDERITNRDEIIEHLTKFNEDLYRIPEIQEVGEEITAVQEDVPDILVDAAEKALKSRKTGKAVGNNGDAAELVKNARKAI